MKDKTGGPAFPNPAYMDIKGMTQRDRDARLIAAAPELLEALEGLMGPVIFGSQTDREILCDWGTSGMEHVTRARAAIAKVKGEQI